jgi:hypothetical protein
VGIMPGCQYGNPQRAQKNLRFARFQLSSCFLDEFARDTARVLEASPAFQIISSAEELKPSSPCLS